MLCSVFTEEIAKKAFNTNIEIFGKDKNIDGFLNITNGNDPLDCLSLLRTYIKIMQSARHWITAPQ